MGLVQVWLPRGVVGGCMLLFRDLLPFSVGLGQNKETRGCCGDRASGFHLIDGEERMYARV
jgi:hypothetical protein